MININELMENFDCERDEHDFFVDVYYWDDIKKALKANLPDGWKIDEFSDHFEAYNDDTEEWFNVWFDERELSIMLREDLEEYELMRINSYHW